MTNSSGMLTLTTERTFGWFFEFLEKLNYKKYVVSLYPGTLIKRKAKGLVTVAKVKCDRYF